MSKPPDLDPGTVDFIVNFTKHGVTQQLSDVDAMDTKAIQLFGVASVVIGLAGFSSHDGGRVMTALLVLAGVFFLTSAAATVMALWPRVFKSGTYATWLWENCWDKSLLEIQHILADDIPNSFRHNDRNLEKKATWLWLSLVTCALEVAAVGAALISSRFS